MCWGLINSEWGQHTNWAQAGGLQNWKQHLKFFREKLSFGMAVNVGCGNKLSWKGDVFLPPFPTLCTPCTSLPSSLPPLLYYPNCGTHTGSIRWWGASLLGIINSGGGRESSILGHRWAHTDTRHPSSTALTTSTSTCIPLLVLPCLLVLGNNIFTDLGPYWYLAPFVDYFYF